MMLLEYQIFCMYVYLEFLIENKQNQKCKKKVEKMCEM